MVTARLPVRVEPVEGEAIDSWLAAMTQAMDVSIGSIARSFGLPAVSHPLWITWLDPGQIDAIAAAAGIPAPVVEAMTLSVYDGTALKLDPTTHRLDEHFPFGAVGFSRFCPACLSESGGRWQLRWRLGWTFACVRHNALLSEKCPQLSAPVES
ncbi:TniQ family protein [Mycobacterium sp. TY815]|uniref:TniQ family protein n=1 Tax=Mycobacterium sp. TY815 TaxID=3050581 RepID=UPI0027422527|nr:TniQ family protein [Mycobacterium sp. TY815]MDP7704884.1 TniQ family protein [Mycobacterium sp. TY815]